VRERSDGGRKVRCGCVVSSSILLFFLSSISLFVSFQSCNIVQGRKRSFIFQIQKANGVAPNRQRYTSTRNSLKSSFRSVGPRFSASVPACFAGVPLQSSNRGNPIFLVDKTRGFFVLFYFCFPISERPPGPYCMRSITVKCARPNPAMPAAQLFTPPAQQRGMTSRSFTLPCQASPTKLGDQLSHSGARVCMRS
jgi:hypothetical protein